jgi:hypothetical protein
MDEIDVLFLKDVMLLPFIPPAFVPFVCVRCFTPWEDMKCRVLEHPLEVLS